jgi:aminoglycoside N3'-acetyltransferase
MNIKDLTNYVKFHLKSLNIKVNNNIIVHANISSFGIHHPQLLKIIIENVLDSIGEKGTLALPIYNVSVAKEEIIDIKKDYNKKENSILTKFFFENYKYIKTHSVFHGHLIKGHLEKTFIKNINYNSFGNKSDFDLFYKNNFKLLLLGCDASQGCTYLHHIENKSKKKYRIKKIFNLRIKLKQKILKKKIIYKVRKSNIHLNFNKIFFHPEVKKITSVADLKLGKSYFLDIKKFDKICTKIIKKNPNILIK